jgi:sulfur carrier protein
MEILLNGNKEHLSAGLTIGGLIRQKNLDPAVVVVEHNLSIVAAEDIDRVELMENDKLEILRFVGGG